jgi:hypothetical protein
MEWVPTRGCFLEQVFRNEQVRRDIRDRVPGGGSFDTGVPGGKSRWRSQRTCCLPTAELSAGFAEGRMYERGMLSWTRQQSCKDLDRNRGGCEGTPHAVTTCGGPAWFTGAARRRK